MPPVTFDTCIFIAYKPESLPPDFVMSVVVVQELITGATDDADIKVWTAAAKKFRNQGRLLVPNMNDWLAVGIVTRRSDRQLGNVGHKSGKPLQF